MSVVIQDRLIVASESRGRKVAPEFAGLLNPVGGRFFLLSLGWGWGVSMPQ